MKNDNRFSFRVPKYYDFFSTENIIYESRITYIRNDEKKKNIQRTSRSG